MRNLETVWCCQHSRSQPRYPFKLCLDCRAEAPYEAIVVEAVVNYFSRTEFQEFVIETEKSIRMGIEPRRADIVLLDGEGHFIAIAECKRTGVVTYGREQLKSYLCATDTQFGVFANSINPDEWEFYENLRRNQFTSMGRSPFQRKIATWRTIESIRGEKNKLDWEIQKASDQYAQKTREIDSSCKQLDELKENIKRKNKQFAQIEEEVVPLRKESSDLKEENTRLKGEITQNSKRAKVVEGLKLESTHDSLRKSIDLLSSERNQLQNEIGTKEQQRWRLSKKINLLREDEDKLDNLSRENTDKLKRAENKIRSERGTLEREKKIWKDGEKERQNYNDYLEQINAKLEKSIKHKNDAVRDLDRLSRLDELVVCHNYLDS
ncbi:MAG: type I restriction enzyme HsdR N-terminal domain-containing protein [Candidatus Poribacteria bacterium]|nr:type I restriction enzyme HsdR N-terminal domain-containing protein [Candidatus Poribacteria bacterium]